MARIDSFLRLVVEQHASDLHFHAGSVPQIRHDGDLVPLPFRVLSEEEAKRFIVEMMTPEQRAEFEAEREIDFAYVLAGVGRFRANAFIQSRGVGAVFRIIPDRIPTLDDVQLPAAVRTLCSHSSGLVLITGPTGSGKSTSLAAIVNEINATSRRHIITVEDPIEVVHPPLKSVVTQRQVGLHTDSFASALRSALREAPDVMVVGEMRDLETMSLALSAAETGVLVFGTLHTGSASKSIDRVLDMYPEEIRDQVRSVLSVMLKGVISQHLCKRATGDGRVGAFEVLLSTYAVAHMIRDNKVHQIDAYLQSVENAGEGMQSLDACLFDLVRSGRVDHEEALRTANYPDVLRKRIEALPAEEG